MQSVTQSTEVTTSGLEVISVDYLKGRHGNVYVVKTLSNGEKKYESYGEPTTTTTTEPVPTEPPTTTEDMYSFVKRMAETMTDEPSTTEDLYNYYLRRAKEAVEHPEKFTTPAAASDVTVSHSPPPAQVPAETTTADIMALYLKMINEKSAEVPFESFTSYELITEIVPLATYPTIIRTNEDESTEVVKLDSAPEDVVPIG